MRKQAKAVEASKHAAAAADAHRFAKKAEKSTTMMAHKADDHQQAKAKPTHPANAKAKQEKGAAKAKKATALLEIANKVRKLRREVPE